MLTRTVVVFLSLLLPLITIAGNKPITNNTGLEYIDTSFENASPLWYEFAEDNSIQIHLLYDHERNSPNRAAGHFHFLLHANPGRSSLSSSETSITFMTAASIPSPRDSNSSSFRRTDMIGNRW